MTQYVLINNSVIIWGPDNLPASWTDDTGTTVLSTLTSDQLIALGWLPYTDNSSDFDPLTQILGSPAITINSDSVVGTYSPTYLELSQCILNKTNAVNNYRDNIFNNGLYFNSNIYDCDETARSNLAGGVIAAIVNSMTLPSGFTWRTKDNQNIAFTGTQLVTFGMAVLVYYNGVLATSWYHKDNIIAMTDQATIKAYNFTTGWPSNGA